MREEQHKKEQRWKEKEDKYQKEIDILMREKGESDSERRKEMAELRMELEKEKDNNRVLQNRIMTFKANEEALEEKVRLYKKRFYDLERSHEEKMKSYEESIYALTQELNMRKREHDKITVENEDYRTRIIRTERKEKSLLDQLAESNKLYHEALKKYERLEDKTSNLRAEIVRVTRERNDAEEQANKYKLKSKVRNEKIKVLEEQLTSKVKECDQRHRAGETLRRVNEEMRDAMDKMQAKIKHMTNNQIKGLEKIISERDQ